MSTLITDYSHTNKLNVYGNTAIYGNTVLSGDLTVSSITSINGVTASTLFIGTDPRRSYLGFYGSYGTYDRSVIAELSNANTGSGAHDAQQELVFFRGSNTGDGIRMQTTGYIKFETGASARVFPSVTSLTTPTMILTSASNVGILTATPSFPLDVAGLGRFQTVSTLALNISSLNSVAFPNTRVISLSSLTGTSADLTGAAAYGINYYITNSAFSTIQIPSVAQPQGWFVTLKNNTAGYLAVNISTAYATYPASPISIPPASAYTLAFDSNASAYVAI